MLSTTQALALIHQHLDETPRAAHSRFVAYLMRSLASRFSADSQLWEVVGLCHDLDFFHIGDDWSQHGLVTIRWLAGVLPDEALQAIAAHDYRTGVQADTPLADMLKLADVVAVIDQRLGRSQFRQACEDATYTQLRHQLADRPYLCDMLQAYARKHGLRVADISTMVATEAEQEAP